MVDMLSSFQEDGEQALIAYTSSQMDEVMSGVKHLPVRHPAQQRLLNEYVDQLVNCCSRLALLSQSSMWNG